MSDQFDSQNWLPFRAMVFVQTGLTTVTAKMIRRAIFESRMVTTFGSALDHVLGYRQSLILGTVRWAFGQVQFFIFNFLTTMSHQLYNLNDPPGSHSSSLYNIWTYLEV